MEWVALLLFLSVILLLLAGFPVAFSLGGTALLFALVGTVGGGFEEAFLTSIPSRIFGIMSNETLVAVPLFVFMGVTLERARIAEELLETLSSLFGSLRGGLGISVTLVGMLLAASTGIVGATVVTMGLLSLPTMLKRGYSAEIATGTICASGTLGQIIPPSIILVMLGDVMSSAYQQAQLAQGIFSPKTVSVGDLFAGALLPGLLLVFLYILYLVVVAIFRPATMPAHSTDGEPAASIGKLLGALFPPLILIFAVLGSILGGFATPTEAAGVGAMGALLIATLRRALSMERLREIMRSTLRISSMVFLILLGDVMSSAYQQAQLAQGIFSPKTVSVGDLFAGALLPGLLLVFLYILYLVVVAIFRPATMPAHSTDGEPAASIGKLLGALFPPLILIFAVLGSILGGFATPTEAAGVGAMGALLIATLRRALSMERLREIMRSTLRISSMVFLILIGASLFSLVFRGYGGDDGVRAILEALPGGVFAAMVLVMLVMFLLGFVLDFIEITFVVVPIVGPVLLAMGLDPVWLGIMIAINLQTSFLTPPFGFALFYLRGVAPATVTTGQIYRGVIPFVGIQLLALLILSVFPSLVTWLPEVLYGQ